MYSFSFRRKLEKASLEKSDVVRRVTNSWEKEGSGRREQEHSV